MPAYKLGIPAAQHAHVPGHLKQAYADGFTEALEKRARTLNWYGSETSYYMPPGFKRPSEEPDASWPQQPSGIYHGIDIRESEQPGFLRNRKSSIPRQRVMAIVKELRKLKGVDVFTDPDDPKAKSLEFGWSVDKNRGYADPEMVAAINKILYGKQE